MNPVQSFFKALDSDSPLGKAVHEQAKKDKSSAALEAISAVGKKVEKDEEGLSRRFIEITYEDEKWDHSKLPAAASKMCAAAKTLKQVFQHLKSDANSISTLSPEEVEGALQCVNKLETALAKEERIFTLEKKLEELNVKYETSIRRRPKKDQSYEPDSRLFILMLEFREDDSPERCSEIIKLISESDAIDSLTITNFPQPRVPEGLSKLSNLVALQFVCSRYSGIQIEHLPPDLAKMKELIALDIRDTKITRIPDGVLEELSKLEGLILPPQRIDVSEGTKAEILKRQDASKNKLDLNVLPSVE